MDSNVACEYIFNLHFKLRHELPVQQAPLLDLKNIEALCIWARNEEQLSLRACTRQIHLDSSGTDVDWVKPCRPKSQRCFFGLVWRGGDVNLLRQWRGYWWQQSRCLCSAGDRLRLESKRRQNRSFRSGLWKYCCHRIHSHDRFVFLRQ